MKSLREFYKEQIINSVFTEKERTVYRLYESDTTQSEIAYMLGITQPTVSRHLKNCESILNKYLLIFDVAEVMFKDEQARKIIKSVIPVKDEKKVDSILSNDIKKIKVRQDGEIKSAIIDFNDEENNVYIEVHNGKNVVLPMSTFRKLVDNG